VDDLRGHYVEALRRANVSEEHARQVFSSPYSSHDSAVAFYESRGVQKGLGIALDILDSYLNRQVPVDKV
jgi:hypothetical protein